MAGPTTDTVVDAGNSIDPVELVLDELLRLLDESDDTEEDEELCELRLLSEDDDIELVELLEDSDDRLEVELDTLDDRLDDDSEDKLEGDEALEGDEEEEELISSTRTGHHRLLALASGP